MSPTDPPQSRGSSRPGRAGATFFDVGDGEAVPEEPAPPAGEQGGVERYEGPAPVTAHLIDTSPYGVRGLAGNVMDWCAGRFDTPPGPDGLRVRLPEVRAGNDNATRVVRGGAWDGNARHARAADRHRFVPNNRFSDLGFRCVFPVQ